MWPHALYKFEERQIIVDQRNKEERVDNIGLKEISCEKHVKMIAYTIVIEFLFFYSSIIYT